MDLNELNKLYFRYRRGELKEDYDISLLIIAQKVRIEQLERDLMTYEARAVSMNNVVAGDIAISGITVGR
jgi:hypothetical protein